MNREEEIEKANPYELNEMMQDYAFKKGAQWADEHPSEETIKKVLSLYDNSFNGFKEDVKKKGIKYIQEHWNDETKIIEKDGD